MHTQLEQRPDDNLDIPEFLRRQKDEPRKKGNYRGLRWTRDMRFDEAKKTADPGTIKLLAEIAAREKAAADRKAIAKEDARVIREKLRTRDRAMLAAVAQLHLMQNPNATEQEIEMAKKAKATKKPARKSRKQVVTRFKTKAPKKAEALKKPRPTRAPKGIELRPTGSGKFLAGAIAEMVPKIKTALDMALKTAVAPKSYAVNSPIVPSKKLAAEMKARGLDPATARAVDAKPESKGAKLERLLRAGKVSAADLAEQLEWLPHTTRAAITRVGFEITTEKVDGVTLYHIAKDAKAKPKIAA